MIRTKLGPSKIHGLGLFADQFVAKETTIWTFTEGIDLLLEPDILGRLPMLSRLYILNYAYNSNRTKRYVLHADNARFINHSTSPNTASVSSVKKPV